MIFQKCVAGIATVVSLGIGMTVLPVETSARSGGFVAAPLPSARGPIRSSFAPLHSAFAHMREFRTARPGDRHGDTSFPLGWANVPSYAFQYADPSGEIPYSYPPTENFSERSRPVVTYQPGCRTDTQQVPSESGGERTIRITRCN